MTEGLSSAHKRSKHPNQKAEIDGMKEKPWPSYMVSTMGVYHIKKHM